MRNNGLPNVGVEASALIFFLMQHSIVRMYHSFYIMDQYIGIQLYQYLYLQQQTLTMILTRESIVWKSLEGIMVNGVPREVPRPRAGSPEGLHSP